MIIDAYAFVTLANSPFEVSKNRIVFEQVRKSASVGNVVDGDDFYVLAPHCSPVDIPADAAKTIYADPGCHLIFLHDNSDVSIPRFSTCETQRKMLSCATKIAVDQTNDVSRAAWSLSRNGPGSTRGPGPK